MLHRKQKAPVPNKGQEHHILRYHPNWRKAPAFFHTQITYAPLITGRVPVRNYYGKNPGSLLPSQAHSTNGKLPRSHLSRLSESFLVCILLLLNSFFLLIFSIVRFFSFVNEGKEILSFHNSFGRFAQKSVFLWKEKHATESDNSIYDLCRLLTSFSILDSRNQNFLLQFL